MTTTAAAIPADVTEYTTSSDTAVTAAATAL